MCHFILPQTSPAILSPNYKVLQDCPECLHHHLCYAKCARIISRVCYLTIISYLLMDYLPLLGLSLLTVADLQVLPSGNPGKLLSTKLYPYAQAC